MNLKGKNVLITGAAKRIGREIARQFAARGARVLIHYHSSRKEAETLAREIKGRLYRADLFKLNEIQRMTRKILKEVGAVDVLVNNASIFVKTPFGKITESDWDRILSTNLKAPFFLAQELGMRMKRKGAGRIINIADWAGLRPYTGYLPYCISKGALITMTQGLAKTLAPEVLVTAVCPGPILPPPDLPREERERAAKKTLVGRWGSPEDIARMTVFLAEQDFVTGSYHLVDGGEFLRG
jgi:NAD(P)-dependent dehydrogenase (short-subunit alcohol dehydrogenase family)